MKRLAWAAIVLPITAIMLVAALLSLGGESSAQITPVASGQKNSALIETETWRIQVSAPGSVINWRDTPGSPGYLIITIDGTVPDSDNAPVFTSLPIN